VGEFCLGWHELAAKGLGENGARQAVRSGGSSCDLLLNRVGKTEKSINSADDLLLLGYGRKPDRNRAGVLHIDPRHVHSEISALHPTLGWRRFQPHRQKPGHDSLGGAESHGPLGDVGTGYFGRDYRDTEVSDDAKQNVVRLQLGPAMP
jgi:hypothetical protein